MLGFEEQANLGSAAFVSAGGYHHHLGVNTWKGHGVGAPPEHALGLRHWTVQLPTRDDVEAVRAATRRRGRSGRATRTAASSCAIRGRRRSRSRRRRERAAGPVDPAVPAERPIDPEVRIGHVHLRTADIDRVRDFYVGVLGFDVVFEARGVPGWGTTGDILFVSAGGYHHHLGFNTWKSAGGRAAARRRRRAAPRGAQLPDRAHGLADTVAAPASTRAWPLRQLTDHGTHLAVYI